MDGTSGAVSTTCVRAEVMEAALTESECFGTTILGKSDSRKGDPITVGSRVVVFQVAMGVRLATGGARTFRVGVNPLDERSSGGGCRLHWRHNP